MTGDLQLFMLWNNGRRLEKQILADIGSRYRHLRSLLAAQTLRPQSGTFLWKEPAQRRKKNQRMRNRTFSCHRCP